jgi:hypothetical protein
MKNKTFNEQQYFRNPAIFILLLVILGLGIWGVIKQVILGQNFGDNPAPNAMLIFFAVIPLIFLLFFIFMKQDTKITEEGIEVVISPFGRRRIAWSSIARANVRAYKPLLEYGGWGIRYGFGGRGIAYSVGGGNEGLQLELKNGQKVLIGTKKGKELSDFLASIQKP